MSAEAIEIPRRPKVAVVLGGGGAKGAYQVGVQKALFDYGFTKFVTITGTSVGALNAVLFDTASPSESREVWMKMGNFAKRSENWRRSISAWTRLLVWALLPFLLLAVDMGELLFTLGKTSKAPLSPAAIPPNLVKISIVHLYLLTATFLNYICTMTMEHYDRVLGHLIKWPKFTDITMIMPFMMIGFVTVGVQVIVPAPELSFLRSRFADVTLRLAIQIAVWLLTLHFWKFYERMGIRLYEHAMNSSLLDRTLLEDLIQERVDCLRNREAKGAKLVANVSIFSSFYDPNYPRYDTPNTPNPFGDDGGNTSAWSPSYISLTGSGFDFVKKVLLTSAALPFAFPNPFESQKSYCDGGVTDNLPIASIFLGEMPDLVFVVPLRKMKNRTTESLFKDLDHMWRRFIKTRVKYLSTHDTLAKKNQAFEYTFKETKPSRHQDNVTVCFIQPSRPLPTIPLPFLSFFTGTLNFGKPALERWMKLGEEDAIECLKKLAQSNPALVGD